MVIMSPDLNKIVMFLFYLPKQGILFDKQVHIILHSRQPDDGYISNNSIEDDIEITNREANRASSAISTISASYLSLSIILLVSAVIL